MKAKTKYLEATKVARIENLIFSGFNLSADFFTLTYSQLSTLKDYMIADHYTYKSPLGAPHCAAIGIACSEYTTK